MLPQASLVIKARRWPILILFAIAGLPFCIAYLMNPQDKALLYFAFGVAFLCVCFALIITRLKIFLDNDLLRIEMLFKKQEVFWRDIVASKLSWQIEGGHTASLNWMLQTKNAKIEIGLGYYARKDMKIIAQQLIDKAKEAEIEDKIYAMAEGRFPWYIF